MSEINKEELKDIIKKFIDRWDNSDKLGWKDLLPIGKSSYNNFNIKISFGQGVRISGEGRPWLAFLKYNQTVSQGIYPIIVYDYKEKKLNVRIGTSFQNEPLISKETIALIKDNNMYFENSKYNIDSIIDNLDNVINYFETLNLNKDQPRIGNPIYIDNSTKIKNIILYGPPGVGKTHNYQNLISMIEENKPQKEIFDTIINNEKIELNNDTFQKIKDEKRVEFITFHQSYSYEDFIEGFRPNENGTIELEDGIFKLISDKASKNLENSQKNKEKINEELEFKEVFELFKDYIQDEIDLKSKFYINETVYIVNIEENAFRYMGENWGHSQRMKFKDIELLYSLNISERRDVKQVDNISGLARQHSTYFSYFMKKLFTFKKRQNINVTFSQEIKQQNYYLVIDEINRGNISKIFGELITLIEEDKRDTYEVTLPYSKIAFKIPSNLYIIATMNSTDKSIATIDIALRRRFTFLKMKPSLELVDYQNARNMMEKLNIYISEKLGEDYKLGHSYFMKVQNDEDLEFVKEYKIKPLLEEYFYADDKSVDEILAEVLSNG